MDNIIKEVKYTLPNGRTFTGRNCIVCKKEYSYEDAWLEITLRQLYFCEGNLNKCASCDIKKVKYNY